MSRTRSSNIRQRWSETKNIVLIDFTDTDTTNDTYDWDVTGDDEQSVYIEGIEASEDAADIDLELVVENSDGDPVASDLIKLTLINFAIIPDYNRDGNIDDDDRNSVTSAEKWRFWVNDDNDGGTDPDTGIAGGKGDPDDMPEQDDDNDDEVVNGVRDLVDFFALCLDIQQTVAFLPEDRYEFRLSQEDEVLSLLMDELDLDQQEPVIRSKAYDFDTATDADKSGAYLFEPDEGYKLRDKDTMAISSAANGSYVLSDEDISTITDDEKTVFLFEATGTTTEPLVLEVVETETDKVFLSCELPLEIVDVKEMFLHENLRDVGYNLGAPGGLKDRGSDDDDFTPSWCMDDSTNTLVWVHGYKVHGDAAYATFAEVFKRLFHAGFNGRFCGVSWYGDPPAPFAPHYHQAVVNAFNVAGDFADFVDTIAGTKTLVAHSLGNMVAGAAIQDHNLSVSNYLAVNAAVALEAYGNAFDEDRDQSMLMVDDWPDYYNHDDTHSLYGLYASQWHTLFDATDSRHELTWQNRLDQVAGGNMYNFYSATEDVLRAYEDDNLVFDEDWLEFKECSFDSPVKSHFWTAK